jgi:Ca-activated chloride channel family protein
MKSWLKLLLVCFPATVCLILGAVFLQGQEGPNSSSGQTVAKPRKPPTDNSSSAPAATDAEQPKIPSAYNKKNAETNLEGPSFKAESNVVTVDVAVVDNRGAFIPKIPKGNFRIMEDGVPQKLTNFSIGEAPITIALVIEFSAKFQNMYTAGWFETLNATYGFVQMLKPEDYVAVIAYDMRSEILSDFTADRSKTQEALARLRIPAFHEANLFDAVTDTANRMTGIEGRKAILLVTSGVDTFSKQTFDQCRKRLQEYGVPIYVFGLLQTAREMADASGRMGPISNLTFLQADNEMRTFAKETGGQAYFPRFYGEYPGIFNAMIQTLRNQYSLGYQPTNQARDGKFRKIKIDLINPATNEPLKVTDEKGKPIKYQVIAKAGYTAPRSVE